MRLDKCLFDYSYPADSVSPPVIGGVVAAGVLVLITATLVVVLVTVLVLKRRQKAVTVTGELCAVLVLFN